MWMRNELTWNRSWFSVVKVQSNSFWTQCKLFTKKLFVIRILLLSFGEIRLIFHILSLPYFGFASIHVQCLSISDFRWFYFFLSVWICGNSIHWMKLSVRFERARISMEYLFIFIFFTFIVEIRTIPEADSRFSKSKLSQKYIHALNSDGSQLTIHSGPYTKWWIALEFGFSIGFIKCVKQFLPFLFSSPSWPFLCIVKM